MYQHTQTYGRRGIALHTISGIDIALWDLAGKIQGQPLHRLLGGARRPTMPVYASDLSQPSLEATLATARKHQAAGYRAMKFGWGGLGGDARQDIAVAAAIRREVGDKTDLMIDMGFAVPFDHAVELGRGLADHGIFFLEEPLSPDDITGFAKLVALSPTPIATGEKESTIHPYLDLMDRGGLRIIQPDVARVGGITEARRIAEAAESRQVRVIPHCWSTDILVSATLHFVSTLQDCPYLEYNATDNPLRTDLLRQPIRPVNGEVRVPDGPGLGIELNEETIERYRWKGV
jgi:L-alanine-DL-glutamate epimerase-like enolase superfamily enzyme